jgi:hypothetical protein
LCAIVVAVCFVVGKFGRLEQVVVVIVKVAGGWILELFEIDGFLDGRG